jgi:hypothetical protein
MVLEAFTNLVGCTIVREEPIVGQLGEYDATRHEIRLHPDLVGIQARAVLAHELGHAAYRHETSSAQNEREADDLGDWLRIPFCYFMRATKVYTTAQEVAHELDVLPADIRRYTRRVWG